MDSRTSPGRLTADGRTAFLIHSITGDPIAIDTATGAVTFSAERDSAEYDGLAGALDAVPLAADGRLLVGVDDGVAVYDATSLERTARFPAEPGYHEAFILEDGLGGLVIGGTAGLARLDAAAARSCGRAPPAAAIPCLEVEVVAADGIFPLRRASGRVHGASDGDGRADGP